MQQHDWRPAARDVVENFSVVAQDFFHGDYLDGRAWLSAMLRKVLGKGFSARLQVVPSRLSTSS